MQLLFALLFCATYATAACADIDMTCTTQSPCLNGGSCRNDVCNCLSSWVGSRCQYPASDVDVTLDFSEGSKGPFQHGPFPILDNMATMFWSIGDTVRVGDIPAVDIGWVAMGIGESMPGSDYAMVQNSAITDQYSEGADQPKDDSSRGGSDNILVSGVKYEGGKTVARFYRPLCAVDTTLDKEIPSSGTVAAIFAYKNQFGGGGDFHAADDDADIHTGWSHVNIDFAAGKLTLRYKPAMTWHACLMSIAWLLLITPSVIVARYFKHIGHRWFIIHRAVNVAAVCLALLAVFIGLADTWLLKDGSTIQPASSRTNHIKIGITTMVFMLINPCLGFYADKLWTAERTTRPFWPDYVHWIVGYACLALAIANVFLGIDFFQADNKSSVRSVAWVYVVIVLIAFVGLEIYFRIRPPQKTHGGSELLE